MLELHYGLELDGSGLRALGVKGFTVEGFMV